MQSSNREPGYRREMNSVIMKMLPSFNFYQINSKFELEVKGISALLIFLLDQK